MRAAAIAEHGLPLSLVGHNGGWRIPLIVRQLGDGQADAITPTFSGIYASPDLNPDEVLEAWSEAIDELRQRGIISLVVRGSPAVAQATSLPGLMTISGDRPSVVVDLSDEPSAWSGLRSSCRSRIRKAQRNGYRAHLRAATMSDLMPGGDFRTLYQGTMRRVDADEVYYFEDDYYEALHAGLGSNLILCEVSDADGSVGSAGLFMRHGGRIHYHLGGSRQSDARMGSNNLMMWTAICFAIEQGLDHFHLGAGAAMHDGVYRFKTTFGGREAMYDVSGLVVDEERYREQVVKRAAELDVSVDELTGCGFFPAYRAANPRHQPKSST